MTAQEERTRVVELAQRSLWLVTACLAIVVLVMTVSLAVVLNVASTAQGRTAAQANIAKELQNELQCRSKIYARSISAQADVISLVALAEVKRSRGDEANLDALINRMDDAVQELQAATVEGSTAVEDCERDKPGG